MHVLMLVLALSAALVATPTPLRLTADVDDAYAPFVNPGGLGLLDGGELRLIMSRPRDGDSTDLALVGALRLGPFALAASAGWDDLGGDVTYTPAFALALGGERFGFGVAWQRIDEEEDHGAWSIGATWRPSRYLSVGVASLDVGQSRGPRPYDLGLATRLFDERLLLSARWRLIHGEDVDHDDGRPDVRMMLGLEPVDGITLAASADLHFRPSIQLGIDFENVGVAGGVARIDDEGVPGAVFGEVSLVSRDRPSVFAFSRVAVLELIGELTPAREFRLFDGGFDEPIYGAVPLLLQAFAHEDDVDGVLLKIGPLGLGWARLEEIRDGVLAIRAAGRRVDCVLSAATDPELYLASACDRVAVLPVLPVSLDGIAGRFVFLGETLDRIGITPQVIQRGAYKSAPEMFTRTSMSEAQREVADALLDQSYATLTEGIAEGRGLPPAEVEAMIALGTMTATEAVSRKLVDATLYPDELEEWVRGGYQHPIRMIAGTELRRPERTRWSGRPAIALIVVDSAITAGESADMFGFGVQSGADTVIRALEVARADRDIKAVVIRVDSPGGDAVASDLIARAVKKVNEIKPVIVSMGDVAASGGYYIAAPAKVIFAEPGTITGSIGIFSLGFSVEKLLTRLGVHTEALFRGQAADRHNTLLDETAVERAVDEKEIDMLYRRFLGVVAEGRKKSVEDVRKLAEGRVWTGKQAHERGLVDELGGLLDAVRRARVEAGLPSDERVEIDVLPSRRARLPAAAEKVFVGVDPLASLGAQLPALVREVGRAVLVLSGLRSPGGAAALLPFVTEVR